MAGIKGLHARLRKLEPKPGFVLRKFGGPEGWERFKSQASVGIVMGSYDRDLGDVLVCLQKWIDQGL